MGRSKDKEKKKKKDKDKERSKKDKDLDKDKSRHKSDRKPSTDEEGESKHHTAGRHSSPSSIAFQTLMTRTINTTFYYAFQGQRKTREMTSKGSIVLN